jgi:hypothetical protein
MVNYLARKHASLASTPLVVRAARRDQRAPAASTMGRVRGEVRLAVVRQTIPTMQRDANPVPGTRTWRPPV